MKLNHYLSLFTICLFSVIQSIAQPLGWSFARPITITNTTASLVTNYQVKVTIDTQTPITAAQMIATGDDIRFGKDCSGTTLFNYWIESGINTSATSVWVKIDTLPASGDITIFMFYGNASATATSAVNGTFNGPHSATDSVASGGAGGVANSQRGFRFSPNEDLLVTSFGKREPTGTNRYITLFDFTTQALINQIQVNGPAGQYNYGNLANPIWLNSGQQYLLELYQDAGDGYYFGSSSQIGQHLTYYDMRYCNGCNQNTFPTNALTNYHYGYPDLWYYTKTNIASLPMITFGAQMPVNTTSTAALTVCSGSSTQLSVSGSAIIGWYDAANGGSYLGGGSVFNTSILDSSSVFYAQDSTSCGVSDRTSISVTVNNLPSIVISGTTGVCAGDTIMLTATGADSYAWTNGPSVDVIMDIPLISTTYTVVGTNTLTNCSDTLTQLVTVNSLPVIVVASPNVLCPGDSIALVATGAETYQWIGGPATDTFFVAPGVATTYTVIGTNVSTNCSDSITHTLSISTLLPVSIDLSNMDSTCSNYSSVPLATATPAGGVWSGVGVNSGNFDPALAGIGTHAITYTITNSDNCESFAVDSIFVSGCVGLNEWSDLGNLTVYPNPNNGSCVIKSSYDAFVTITNELGQVVERATLNQMNSHEVKLEKLSGGIYFLYSSEGHIRKIIVTK